MSGKPIDPANRVELGFAGLYAARGDHIGHFYRTKQDWKDLLVPFLAAGLSAGDRCIYFTESSGTRDEIRAALAAAGVEVKVAIAKGQLTLENGQGSPEEMQAYLHRALAEIPSGFPFLRWGGDMTWSLGAMPDTEELMKWETACNAIDNPPATFLCQYDLTRFSGGTVVDALRTHPFCITGSAIHQNPFFEKPEAFLDELQRRRAEPAAR